jgi:hypothetical protein
MPNCGRKIKAPNYNRKTDKVLTSPSWSLTDKHIKHVADPIWYQKTQSYTLKKQNKNCIYFLVKTQLAQDNFTNLSLNLYVLKLGKYSGNPFQSSLEFDIPASESKCLKYHKLWE